MLRISTLIWLVLSVVTGSLLFTFSQKTALEHHATRALERKISFEKQRINVLEAEWSYLNRPSRLRQLVKNHINLHEVRKVNIANSDLLALMTPPPAPAPKPEMEQMAARETDVAVFALREKPKAKPVTAASIPKREKSFQDLLGALRRE